ncbi:MAG: PAS domain S-box protein [Anaerolineaceae bacterium]|nr:PAS domain S-box protein [Anaerolineaceae bacterium]
MQQKNRLSRKIRVPLIYGVFSILWIVLSDRLTLHVASDMQTATWIAIAKGSAFVLFSTLLIYLLLAFDERREKVLEVEIAHVQEGFSSLFEDNPEPMWILDVETMEFLSVNRAALEFFGYGHEEFLSLTPFMLFTEDQTDLLRRHFDSHEEGIRRTGPWRLTLKSGETRYAYIVVVDVDFADRRTHLATVADISEQKEIEEKLNKTTSERDNYESFGFSVSHDLRASLRAVDGYSQILLEDYGKALPAQVVEYLEKIQSAAANMQLTTSNLMTLAGISRKSVKPCQVNLSDVVHEIQEQLQRMDPERRVEVKITPAVYGYCDPELIQTVLFDLFENAWKFTSKTGQARIEFGSLTTAEGEKAYFVRDNGAGFDPSQTQLMFTPFERFHPATDFPGSGIGLSVVARVIERHRGRVWAEGQVGQGATFYFTLGEPA